MSDQLDSYGMNAKQNLGTKIKYRCTQVRIWCGQDDKKVSRPVIILPLTFWDMTPFETIAPFPKN